MARRYEAWPTYNTIPINCDQCKADFAILGILPTRSERMVLNVEPRYRSLLYLSDIQDVSLDIPIQTIELLEGANMDWSKEVPKRRNPNIPPDKNTNQPRVENRSYLHTTRSGVVYQLSSKARPKGGVFDITPKAPAEPEKLYRPGKYNINADVRWELIPNLSRILRFPFYFGSLHTANTNKRPHQKFPLCPQCWAKYGDTREDYQYFRWIQHKSAALLANIPKDLLDQSNYIAVTPSNPQPASQRRL
jgi:hypothetical protein